MGTLEDLLRSVGLESYLVELQSARVSIDRLRRMRRDQVQQLSASWPLGDRFALEEAWESLGAGGSDAPAAVPASAMRNPGRRETPAAPGESAEDEQPGIEVDPEVVASLPVVLARPLSDLLAADSPERIIESAERLTDLTLRFVALVGVADYLAHPAWHDAELSLALDRRLRRPALGHWAEFIRNYVRSAEAHDVVPFLRELPETWRTLDVDARHPSQSEVYNDIGKVTRRGSVRLSTVSWLINARNALAHGKRTRADASVAVPMRQVAIQLALGLRWLVNYELWDVGRSASFLLRGVEPRPEAGGPRALGAAHAIVVRRRASGARDGMQQLELAPLIVSEQYLMEAGRPGEPALYNCYAFRDCISYTPVSGVPPAIETSNTDRDYRRKRESKQYRRLCRREATKEDLLARVRDATRRSIETLVSTAKYRPELHVPRARYEDRLEAWIRSPKPLLGIQSRAGGGKTGVLASLALRWQSQPDADAVLLVLARDFDSASLDRILRELLILDDDLTMDQVTQSLGGLVVVIDGLNEHSARADLLDAVVSAAERSHRLGVGPRFAISWRTEDRDWVTGALEAAELWWVPPVEHPVALAETDPMEDVASDDVADSGGPAEAVDSRDTESEATGRRLPRREHRRLSAAAGQRASDPSDGERCISLEPLDDDELSAIWERYREKDPEQSRPRFSFQALFDANNTLAESLRNPLDMRIALEMFHDQDLPSVVEGDGLYPRYLAGLRSEHADVGELLPLMARLMAERLSPFVHEFELADNRRSLVHSDGPISALDLLERRGVVTIRVDRGEKLVCFTNERVAEQVLGEWIASDAAAAEPQWIARRARDLESLVLSTGAFRVAAEVLVGRHGLEHLIGLIDAEPPSTASICGPVLADVIRRTPVEAVPGIASMLVSHETEADFDVALSASWTLWFQGSLDRERAFLEPVVHRVLGGRRSSQAAAGLCSEMADVLERGARNPEDEEEATVWLESVASHWEAVGRPEDACLMRVRLARRLVRLKRFEDAVACSSKASASAATAGMRRLRCDAERVRAEALLEGGEHAASVDAFNEALRCWGDPEPIPGWNPAWCHLGIAQAMLQLGRVDETIEAERNCLEAFLAEDDTLQAVFPSARIAEALRHKGDTERSLRYSRHAVDLARKCGSRRVLALAYQWYADNLRLQSKFEEAETSYRDAIDSGMTPTIAPDWSPVDVLEGLAEVLDKLDRPLDAANVEELASEMAEADDELGQAARAASRAADLFERVGEKPRAIQLNERALSLAERLGDRCLAAHAHHWLASCHLACGSPSEAISVMLRGIAVAESAEQMEAWDASVAYALVARCHRELSEYQQAADWDRKSMEDLESRGEHSRAAYPATRVGTAIGELGRIEEAIVWKKRAVELAERAGDRSRQAVALEWLADLLARHGRLDDAIGAYRQALAVGLTPTRAEDWGPAHVHGAIAKVLLEQGKIEQSIAEEKLALRGYLHDGDLTEAAYPAVRIGSRLVELGRNEDATRWKVEAVTLADRAGSDRIRFIARQWLGDHFEELKRWDDAIRHFRDALDIPVELGAERAYHARGLLLHRIARCDFEMGRVDEAIDGMRGAVKLLEEVRSFEDAAEAASAAGGYLLGKGDARGAGWWFREATLLAERSGKLNAIAWHFEALGRFLHDADRHQEALRAFARSLAITDSAPAADVAAAARTLARMSECHHQLGQWSDAERCCTRRMESALERGDLRQAAWAADAMAELREGQMDEAGGIAWRERAVALAEQSGSRRDHSRLLEFMGDALQASGRLQDAWRAYEAALAVGFTPERADGWSAAFVLVEMSRNREQMGDRGSSESFAADAVREALELPNAQAAGYAGGRCADMILARVADSDFVGALRWLERIHELLGHVGAEGRAPMAMGFEFGVDCMIAVGWSSEAASSCGVLFDEVESLEGEMRVSAAASVARVAAASGDCGAAVRAATIALELSRELEVGCDGTGLTALEVLCAAGDPQVARAWGEWCLAQLASAKGPQDDAERMNDLSQCHRAMGVLALRGTEADPGERSSLAARQFQIALSSAKASLAVPEARARDRAATKIDADGAIGMALLSLSAASNEASPETAALLLEEALGVFRDARWSGGGSALLALAVTAKVYRGLGMTQLADRFDEAICAIGVDR